MTNDDLLGQLRSALGGGLGQPRHSAGKSQMMAQLGALQQQQRQMAPQAQPPQLYNEEYTRKLREEEAVMQHAGGTWASSTNTDNYGYTVKYSVAVPAETITEENPFGSNHPNYDWLKRRVDEMRVRL